MNGENKQLALSKQLPVGDEAEAIMKWSQLMSKTKFYQQMIVAGGENALLAIFLTARSLDVDPMIALSGGIYCVQGRTTLSAQLMNLMIRRHGHSIVKKIGTSEKCHLVGKRRDNGDTMESVFTIEMAERAGLLRNPIWKQYPERMLFSRALSNLAKELFPDCIGNSLCEGEIEEAKIEIIDQADLEEVEAFEPYDEVTAAFVDEYKIDVPDSAGAKFIDHIVARTGDTRRGVITSAAKDGDKFFENFVKYSKK